MILEETISFLRLKCQNQVENLSISDVHVGVHLTAIRLSDESYGIASTIVDHQIHCDKENRDFGDFSPSRINGQKVLDLLDSTKKSAIVNTLKVAVLNAISSKILTNTNYKILENTDPIDLLDLKSKKTISMIGAFPSYIKKIAQTQNKLHVLEINENALKEEHKQYYIPANEYHKILPCSEIVIITGMALVNNTIDGLLSSIPTSSKTIVTGPSSSLVPDILFRNKVDIIGATRITKPRLLFTIVREAGTGYHLFKYCAQKICILNG